MPFWFMLKNNDLSHFDSLHTLVVDNYQVECSRFLEDIEALSCQFESRFRDFDRLKPFHQLYNGCTVVTWKLLET